MAFLDNSGDIILDAVLTDVGRKKMAEGNFKIVKFALGDDEIDYGLYNKNNPSGSAYYDLEILQTPIFEAFTAKNANINYGLLTISREDLLYLPVMLQNTKDGDASAVKADSNGIVNLAVNGETAQIIQGLARASTAIDSPLISSATNGLYILLETELNTTDLAGTSANRSSYLMGNNLINSETNISIDNRFLNAVLANGRTKVKFKSNPTTGVLNVSIGTLQTMPVISNTTGMENYSTVKAAAIPNGILYNPGVSVSDTSISAIAGPRGSAQALNFIVDTALTSDSTGTRDQKWSFFGKLNQRVFADKDERFDLIDTIVYVEGTTTSSTIQLPIRLLRYVSAT